MMSSCCKSLFCSLLILQICIAPWVAAQEGEVNVTSPAEVLNASLAEGNESSTPANVQSDQGNNSPQTVAESKPPTPAAASAAETDQETEVPPTRQTNVQSTTPPPLVRVETPGEQTKNETTKSTSLPHANPTEKGSGATLFANFALITVGIAVLLH